MELCWAMTLSWKFIVSSQYIAFSHLLIISFSKQPCICGMPCGKIILAGMSSKYSSMCNISIVKVQFSSV